jgi:hypothetical protein
MSENAPLSTVDPPPSETIGDRRRRRYRGGTSGKIVAISAAILLGFLAISVLIFGYVEGREFAPTHFKTRKFWYLEIPILGVQVWPIVRTEANSSLQQYLVSNSLVANPPDDVDTWHLIEVRRWFLEEVEGDAKLLDRYLNYFSPDNEVEPFWKGWTTRESGLAKALWPRVQGAACGGRYSQIPTMFRIAASGRDVAQVERELDQYLARPRGGVGG